MPGLSQHEPDGQPERHVIGPLTALGEGGDRREEPAEHGQVERRDAQPAERRRATTSPRSGSTAASTYAQPNDSAPCTGAPAANSTQVRSSRGSRTFPSARPPSVTSPPSSSVHTVDGAPDTIAPTSPALSA